MLSYGDGADSYQRISGNYAAVKGYMRGSYGIDEYSGAVSAYPSETSNASQANGGMIYTSNVSIGGAENTSDASQCSCGSSVCGTFRQSIGGWTNVQSIGYEYEITGSYCSVACVQCGWGS